MWSGERKRSGLRDEDRREKKENSNNNESE